jgi:MEMO1 family protein
MPIVFAAITPHSPMLIASVGKDAHTKTAETQKAFKTLEQELYLAKPHTLIVISPHTGIHESSFSVNAHTAFRMTLTLFGDMTTVLERKGSTDLCAKIQHTATMSSVPVQLVSEPETDHGVAVPTLLLTEHLPDIRILPIGYSTLSPKDHLQFGEMLKEVCMESDKRIAVIASGDFAHTLTSDAPSGYHADGALFDKTMRELLETKNTAGVLTMSEQTVHNAKECGYRSTLILLGMLRNMDYTFRTLAYEAPFGVGFFTGQFVF